ncbi:MAG: hypothetical protein GTN81_11830 [Proteobacteria bacterium]|nr:hypothetical protein [Pseudomonadota bacterium]
MKKMTSYLRHRRPLPSFRYAFALSQRFSNPLSRLRGLPFGDLLKKNGSSLRIVGIDTKRFGEALEWPAASAQAEFRFGDRFPIMAGLYSLDF